MTTNTPNTTGEKMSANWREFFEKYKKPDLCGLKPVCMNEEERYQAFKARMREEENAEFLRVQQQHGGNKDDATHTSG